MVEGLMRDFPQNPAPENAVEAARRAVRPVLHRRFYRSATAAVAADGFSVRLDDKPVRTPAGRALIAPTLRLAQAIAAEWDAQGETIDPAAMPLTRLANSIIDGVRDRPVPVAAEVRKYLGSDLVCYRAGSPQALVDRQARAWDPILDWARQTLSADFMLGEGVIPIAQPGPALAAAAAAIPDEAWRLGAMHAVTTLTGSALIALALHRGRLTADEAWAAAHVDEDWNIEQWGEDELARERRAFRLAEFLAAASVLRALPASF
jgi:chaperone required for assembly of F1-ATPase